MDDIAWEKAILKSGNSIEDAIRNLNDTALKIVMVADDHKYFLGTISDGDIRRGLLRGLTLSSPIQSIVHQNALVVPAGMTRDTVLSMMTANKVQQIPVVDDDGKIVGLHIWDEVSSVQARSNSMVIMAGGMGTRLLPHTESCPKPMLLIQGKPMLEHIIERARSEGFSHFILAIHHLGHMIEEYFGDGRKFGVRIDYLREKTPLGTAGALSLLDPLPKYPFVVTNGDVITDIRYGEILDFHLRHQAAATMAVRVHEWQHPFGVVEINGVEIIGFEEKPIARSHVNAGVYVIEPESLDQLQKDARCDMPTLFERLQEKGHRTVAYPMHEPWLDVGRPDDLAKARSSEGLRS
jgi:dTDP-glucose pyrophosphorylase